MVLTTHAITGAAVASVLPANPVLAFFAGVVSHYLLDMIPHWEYKLLSRTPNKNGLEADLSINGLFVLDLARVGFDFLLGVFFVWLIFQPTLMLNSAIWWGMIGGVLPDPLQFVYFKFRHEPMLTLQKVHHWFHSPDLKLRERPFLGIIQQSIIVLIVLALTYVVRSLFF